MINDQELEYARRVLSDIDAETNLRGVVHIFDVLTLGEGIPASFEEELHTLLKNNPILTAPENIALFTDSEYAAKGFWWWDPTKW